MRETELTQMYLDQLLAVLATPLGMAGLLAMLALVAACVTVPAMRWVCVAALIYVSTIPLPAGANIQYARLAPGLEQLRAFGRPLIYLFLALMLIPLLLSESGWRRRILALPLVLFIAFELLISVRLIAFGNVSRGLLSVMTYGVIVLSLGVGLSRWLQTVEDFYKLLWGIAVAGGLVALGTCYQLAVNRSLIVTNSRLVGVTGNPQFLGIIIAYTLPIACHLLTRPNVRAWVKPVLIVQVAVMAVMLVWTGSRTGVLSTGLALIVLFHRRLGRFAVLGVVVAAAMYVAFPYFEGSAEIADRLIWTTNTRAGAWAYMFENFKQAPLLGVSRDAFETAESSYLAMLSQFGILGSLPCLIAVVIMAYQGFRLLKMRSRFGSENGLADVVLGLWTAIFVTSVFEGLLMGVITFPVFMIYVNSAMTTFLIDWAEVDETYAAAPADDASAYGRWDSAQPAV